ncbi:hypothetical protein ACFE04_002689 [Oxalis oulophora]
MSWNVMSFTFDALTRFPHTLLTSNLSMMIAHSVVSSSIMPPLSSSSISMSLSSPYAKAISKVVSLVATTQNTPSLQLTKAGQLYRRLDEVVLHSATSFMDFSKRCETELQKRVLALETSIKEMKEEKASWIEKIKGLQLTLSKLEWSMKRVEDETLSLSLKKIAKISSLECTLAGFMALASLRSVSRAWLYGGSCFVVEHDLVEHALFPSKERAKLDVPRSQSSSGFFFSVTFHNKALLVPAMEVSRQAIVPKSIAITPSELPNISPYLFNVKLVNDDHSFCCVIITYASSIFFECKHVLIICVCQGHLGGLVPSSHEQKYLLFRIDKGGSIASPTWLSSIQKLPLWILGVNPTKVRLLFPLVRGPSSNRVETCVEHEAGRRREAFSIYEAKHEDFFSRVFISKIPGVSFLEGEELGNEKEPPSDLSFFVFYV